MEESELKRITYRSKAASDVARILDEAQVPNVLWGWIALSLLAMTLSMEDVEFFVDLGDSFDSRIHELPSGAPELLKLGLSLMHPDEFWQSNQYFQVDMSTKSTWDKDLPINFTPTEMSPYTLQEARPIFETKRAGDLP
ncbi:hypothetical protein NUU61_005380 [Penicillium alfredii]|uniref:Uncharacterized protein n=1 Tax=Penicillium alfredii TaxID=1506179 RepID=A0A9W9F9G5_9EURO|nr:uncharacterized protein NUU61_005380 [Penicillium alfredii]KAJ5096024.1 hypothetical protein NUU61_005380 [Penicillium alfredii]